MVGLYRYASKSVSLFVLFNKKIIFLTIFIDLCCVSWEECGIVPFA